jgi:hypothetical protein
VGWLVGESGGVRSEEEEASVACLEKGARGAWAYIGLPLPVPGRARRVRIEESVPASSLDLGFGFACAIALLCLEESKQARRRADKQRVGGCGWGLQVLCFHYVGLDGE